MKIKHSIARSLALLLFAALAISSCKKDDSTTDVIVGTWTAGTSTFSATVGGKTLTQYFVDELGMTQEEAQLYADFLEMSIQASFTGTITVKSDHTYTSDLGGESDRGTWSLNSARTQLTIDSDTDDPYTYDVVELTASKLHLSISETIMEDLNGDTVPEEILLEGDVNFTK